MHQRLAEGGGWPLDLVDAVYVFGSYARGALEPGDVDVAVDFRSSGGRDPRIDLRQALIGRQRGMQFQFGATERQQLEKDDVAMLRLWCRSDTLAQALAVPHGIKEDAAAGRAQRDDMTEEFEGVDRYIPRPVRAELIAWRDAGLVTFTRLNLPETQTVSAGKTMAWVINTRWKPDSRCAPPRPPLPVLYLLLSPGGRPEQSGR
ncbi:nucleotidyltransferase domain-containing protein [Streptomyces lunaelactis]|nr:nucleotidyltransferase domain-containing protein [Streptomyces lunaelactis]